MRKRERKRSDKSELRRVSVKRDGEIAERLRALASGGSADNRRITSGVSENPGDLIPFYAIFLWILSNDTTTA